MTEREEKLTLVLIEGRALIESSISHVSHGGPTRKEAEEWLFKVNTALGRIDAENALRTEAR